MRVAFACLAVVAVAGCGGGSDPDSPSRPVTPTDVTALEIARSKFLSYCGERKANGADETQPVPKPIEEAVDRTLAILAEHRDASFEFRGEKTTVEAFVREQEDTLEDCSDQQQQRVTAALGD